MFSFIHGISCNATAKLQKIIYMNKFLLSFFDKLAIRFQILLKFYGCNVVVDGAAYGE